MMCTSADRSLIDVLQNIVESLPIIANFYIETH